MGLPWMPENAAMVDHWALALVETAARSVVILGLAGGAALALRRASAAARHGVWLLGFAGLLLMPALSAALPGWHVLPRLGERRGAAIASTRVVMPALDGAAVPAASVETAAVETPVRGMEAPAPAASGSPSAGPQEMTSVRTIAEAAPARVTKPASGSGASTAAPSSQSAPGSQRAPLSWTFWVVVVWLGGGIVVLGYVLLGNLSLWSLQRRCGRMNEGEWPELLGQLCRVLRVRRPVELLWSPRRAMPMTWGLWRARVLLPREAAAWPAEQRRAVLLHELGHVRRWDCMTQLVAQMGCAMYWFNPLVWMAWHRMQIERERACDDLVLNAGAKASAYAQHLLESAAAMPGLRFVGAAVAMARPSTLEERLRAILDGRRNRRGLSGRSAMVMLLLAVALVPVAVLQAQTTPADGPAAARDVPVPPGYRGQVAGYFGTAQEVPVPAVPTPVGAGGAPGGTAPPPPTPTAPPMPTRGRGRGGPGLGAMDGGMSAVPPAPAAAVDGPTCALDATVYDVRLPADQIGRLDIEKLKGVAAASPAEFEKYLASLGATQPLYRANQSVRLIRDFIQISTQTPFITNSQVTNAGQTINSVGYRQTGATFSLAGKTGETNGIDLDMTIQVSTLTESTTPISTNVKAPLFRQATMTHKGPVTADKPFVVVSVDAASVDGEGKAVAYIARITMGAPQSSGAGATMPAAGK